MSLYQQFIQDMMALKAKKPNMGFCPACGWNSDLAHNGNFEPCDIDPADCENCKHDAECISCGMQASILDEGNFVCSSCYDYKYGHTE